MTVTMNNLRNSTKKQQNKTFFDKNRVKRKLV